MVLQVSYTVGKVVIGLEINPPTLYFTMDSYSVINPNVNETTEEYMNGVYVDTTEDILVENTTIKSVKVIPTGFKYVR